VTSSGSVLPPNDELHKPFFEVDLVEVSEIYEWVDQRIWGAEKYGTASSHMNVHALNRMYKLRKFLEHHHGRP